VLSGLHWFTSSDYLVFWWHLQTLLKISILCMYLLQLTCSVYAGQDFLRPDSSLWTWHLFRYPPITLYEDFTVVRVWMISHLPSYTPQSKSIAESTVSYVYICITQSVFVEVDRHKTVY
jgi:hypothetical protein